MTMLPQQVGLWNEKVCVRLAPTPHRQIAMARKNDMRFNAEDGYEEEQPRERETETMSRATITTNV